MTVTDNTRKTNNISENNKLMVMTRKENSDVTAVFKISTFPMDTVSSV